MSITGDYPQPVTVNGFSCKNCTDVDYAKKQIDPAHPKSGPYGVNARSDPTRADAVTFGGSLSGHAAAQAVAPAVPAAAPGQALDIQA